MRIVKTNDKNFSKILDDTIFRSALDISEIESTCKTILNEVHKRGDKALLEYTRKFDSISIRSAQGLIVKEEEIESALKKVPKTDLNILKLAARRIKQFHKKTLTKSWTVKEKNGTVLGQRIMPLERIGIYVPGGKASYPSTVLMNAIPPRIAGVKDVLMTTPPGNGGVSPYILAAARIAGVDSIFKVGGAQAVAAFAYGTKTIPKVDKIVGPGNIYVATAKRLVFGKVGIDMIAGPSEILILNDGTGNPVWIAADLLSQAEHDELASSILITTSSEMAEAVSSEVEQQLALLQRNSIARQSVDNYGIIIKVEELEEAVNIANRIAPEHLEVITKKPGTLLNKIRNAGAIFLGHYTPEAFGDYIAGPNHTLPTGGTARFSSPLGVEDFLKRSSVISFSKKGFEKLSKKVSRFANIEGLEAHGKSVDVRLKKPESTRRA